jgi:hypothetical protein
VADSIPVAHSEAPLEAMQILFVLVSPQLQFGSEQQDWDRLAAAE